MANILKDYTSLTQGAEIARGLGQVGRASKLEKLAAKYGPTGGVDNATSLVPNLSGEFNPTDFSGGVNALKKLSARGVGEGDRGRVSRNVNAKANSYLTNKSQENTLASRTAMFDEKYAPSLDSAMANLNDLQNKALVSASQENQLRSDISSDYTRAASSALDRLSATLGLRGQQGSPAGAAIASRMATQFDADKIGQLSKMALNVNQMNQQAQGQRATAAAQITGYSAAARDAFLRGDQEAVAGIGDKMAQLADSLYTSNMTFDIYKQQIADAQRASEDDWMDKVGKFGSMLSAFPQFSFMGMGSSPGTPMSQNPSPSTPTASPTSGGTGGGGDMYWGGSGGMTA